VRLSVIAVGRLKAGPERDLMSRYVDRIRAGGKSLGLGPLAIVEIEESRARRADERKADEAARLLVAAAGEAVIALDENGQTMSSMAFGGRISGWRDAGTPGLAFVIGGADGLGAEVLKRSALVLSFGAMTMPHQIVRILLAEQIYRSTTILSGHPYHRG